MANDEQPTPAPAENLDAIKHKSSQVDQLQNQLGNILSGVEKSLAVTCESIMGKMKQLEDKIQDMEKRCTELAKDAEQTLKEVATIEPKPESEISVPATIPEAGEPAASEDTTVPTTQTSVANEEVQSDEVSKQ